MRTHQNSHLAGGTDPRTAARHQSPICADREIYITARQLRHRLGGVSDMSIWRWSRDAALAFPKPIRINSRRFWRLSDLVAWEQSQEASGAPFSNTEEGAS